MVVDTRYGRVQGVRESTYIAFKGIPFAKPPVGRLRFKPPEEPDPWDGIRVCDTFCKSAPQVYSPYVLIKQEDCSEDCLYLNVYTPALDGKKRPVLFNVHGGAFQQCNHSFSSDPKGTTDLDCVLVTGHYRLGALGFFQLDRYLGEEYIQSGNSGMLDIIMILKWMHENIGNFGGDPDNIIIAGQSAGSKMVASLLCAKKAHGQFSAAMMDSGSSQAIRDLDTAREIAERFAKSMGLTKENAREKLLESPWEEIIRHQEAVFTGRYLHNCGPVFDGINFDGDDALEIIRSGKANYVTILGGSNHQEYGSMHAGDTSLDDKSAEELFGVNAPHVQAELAKAGGERKFVEAITNYLYGYPTADMFNAFADAKQGNAMYMYRFDWDADPRGAYHTLCSSIATNSLPRKNPRLCEHPEYPKVYAAVSDMWNSFLKKQDPNTPLLPEWPKFTAENRKIMLLGAESRVADVPETDPDMPHQILKLVPVEK